MYNKLGMEIREKAKSVRAVVLDGDGVFFTGRVFVDKDGEKLKERSHIDGQGVSLLRASGIRIAFVTNEKSGFLESIVDKLNNLPSCKEGRFEKVSIFTNFIGKGKVGVIGDWLEEIGVSWAECAYMGDDLGDYEILKKVGLKTAPAQAEEVIKKICDYVTERVGGDGAIRDVANLILDAKGIDPTTLSLK